VTDRVIVIVGCAICVVAACVMVWRLRRGPTERATAVIVHRSMGTIVDAVKKPVTIAVLEQVAEVLRCGQYAGNMAAALEENRAELDAMILELVRNDPQIGKLRYLPFHEDIIRGLANTGFRVLFQVLADPRIDELVGDVLRENVHQMRDAVKAGVRVPETVDNRLVQPR
jgi:voltage-gated potassium channel